MVLDSFEIQRILQDRVYADTPDLKFDGAVSYTVTDEGDCRLSWHDYVSGYEGELSGIDDLDFVLNSNGIVKDYML